MADCELCATPGGILLWQSPRCRVVRVEAPDHPGFCRVIWQAHVREMTDLPAAERQGLMAVVFAVESVLREVCRPDKINLASFGNMTPHLHWHIIPRWRDDTHFPEPIWGRRQRDCQTTRPGVTDAELGRRIAAILSDLEGVQQ